MAKESKAPGLSMQQKTALIGGALILAAVLLSLLWPSVSPAASSDSYRAFASSLVNNSRSGIMVDVRGASSPDARQKLLQCETDLVQSSDFYPRTGKDLLVYYCDDSGCLSSRYRYDLPKYSFSYDNRSVPFADALYALQNRTYFYIHYSPSSQPPAYSSRYAEIFITANSSESCGINVTFG